jgi:hypothetical protein
MGKGNDAALAQPAERSETGGTMATARQIAANRKNAQRSTGPRTEAGKSDFQP